MKLSEAQRKWLTHLRDHGPDTSRNRAGWFCRKNGLTEWVYVVRETGETVARSEAMWTEDFQRRRTEYTGHRAVAARSIIDGIRALKTTPADGAEGKT